MSTAMTASSRPPRRWPWIVGFAAAFVAIAIGVGLLGWRGGQQPSATASSAPPTPDSSTVGAIDACLGGTSADAATVAAAQAEAPHTSTGAVAYAATFGRWIYQIPLPSDLDEVKANNGLSDDQWASYSTSAASWTGPVPVAATTITGRYRIDDAADDVVKVTLVLPLVVDGAVLPTRRFVPTLTVSWTGNRWEVTDASGDSAGSDDLASLGNPFEGGC